MTDLTHYDLEQHLCRLEDKFDALHEVVVQIRIDLATHKAKTSWLAMGGSAFVSLMIGLAAYFMH